MDKKNDNTGSSEMVKKYFNLFILIQVKIN